MNTVQRLLACVAFVAFGTAAPNAVSQDKAHPITARNLATLRDLNGLSVSPDQRWAAFSIMQADPDHNRNDIAWYVFDIAQRRARRVADGGEMLPTRNLSRIVLYEPPGVVVWSPDSLWIAFLRSDNRRTQIWRARRDGDDAEQLTHNEADVRALVYARDGHRVLFQTEPSEGQLAQSMAAEGRSGFIYDERFVPLISPLPLNPPDTKDIHTRFTRSQIAARHTWVYELASGRERLATDAEQAEYATLTAPAHAGSNVGASASSRGGSTAWAEARDPERQGWVAPQTIVAQAAGALGPIVCVTAPECTADSLSGLWWRSDSELLFLRNEGLRRQDRALYLWRPNASEAPRLVFRTPDDPSDCAVASDRLICLYEQPDHPRRLLAIDANNGAIETLYDPNPDFSRLDLGQAPRRLSIRAFGVETYGYLVLPSHRREGERLPLVIVTYRCRGFLRGGVGDEYPIYPLVAQGFAVLCFETPEDFERQARLSLAAYINWSRGKGNPTRRRVEDALDSALAQLDAMGAIDPHRVGLTGLSFGAEIVGFALLHLPRLAAASASGSVGAGTSAYPYLAPPLRAQYRDWGLGPPEQTPERWQEFSFSPHVQRVTAPLLLNVADRELLTNLDAVTALQDAERAVEMYVFPDEYHQKWQPAHRLSIYERNIDWMNFWLQGREDPSPAKAEQYKRWRAMRAKQCELFKGDGAPWYCRD